MKTCICFGTRPEIIKLWSIIKKLQRKGEDFFLIHTGQHYDQNMSEFFFQDLKLPKPKYNLNINAKTDIQQIALTMTKIYDILQKEKPNILIVQGDTNVSISSSLAARKAKIHIAHIEAGLRSYDDIPEETNRIITDHLSRWLLCPTQNNYKTLHNGQDGERIHHKKCYITGNTIIDLLKHLDKYKKIKKRTDKYILITLHRQNNVDNKTSLNKIIWKIALLCHSLQIHAKFCCHPRTTKRIKDFNIHLPPVIKILPPQRYFDFLSLLKNAKLVITDSGGVIEESNYYKIPCVVTRIKFERQEALTENTILAHKQEDIVKVSKELLARNRKKWTGTVFGNGNTANEIYKIIYEKKW